MYLLIKKLFYNSLFLFFIQCSASHLEYEIHGGMAPTVWTKRSQFAAISSNAIMIFEQPNFFVPLFKMPAFKDIFSVPIIVGMQIKYDLAPCFYVYVNMNFRHAHKQVFNLNKIVVPSIDIIQFNLKMQNNYRALDFTIGFHRNFWLRDINIFAGIQYGFLYRKKVDFIFSTRSQTVSPPLAYVSNQLPFFTTNISPVGGLSVGASMDLDYCLSLVIMGQLMVSRGPQFSEFITFDFPNESVFVNPYLAPNAFKVGIIKTEIFFPITIGLQYNF